MMIDVLYFEGCPNHSLTVELVEAVVGELGIAAEINQVPVSDVADAKRLRFFGSPSVHVNGVDIDPDTKVRTDYAYSCRVYGMSGVPPKQMLIDAIRGHGPSTKPQP